MDWIHHTLRTKGSFEEMIRFATEFRQHALPVKSSEAFDFFIRSIHLNTFGKEEGIVKMEIAFDHKWEPINPEHPFFQKNCISPSGIPAEMEFYDMGRDIGWIQYIPGTAPIVRGPAPEFYKNKPREWDFKHHFPDIPSLFRDDVWDDFHDKR